MYTRDLNIVPALLLGLAFASPTTAMAQASGPGPMGGPSICFSRSEDNGRLNITPVNIFIDDYQTLRLLGGRAGCLYLPEFRYKAFISWNNAGHRGQSPPVNVDLKRGHVSNFYVCPLGNSEGFSMKTSNC